MVIKHRNSIYLKKITRKEIDHISLEIAIIVLNYTIKFSLSYHSINDIFYFNFFTNLSEKQKMSFVINNYGKHELISQVNIASTEKSDKIRLFIPYQDRIHLLRYDDTRIFDNDKNNLFTTILSKSINEFLIYINKKKYNYYPAQEEIFDRYGNTTSLEDLNLAIDTDIDVEYRSKIKNINNEILVTHNIDLKKENFFVNLSIEFSNLTKNLVLYRRLIQRSIKRFIDSSFKAYCDNDTSLYDKNIQKYLYYRKMLNEGNFFTNQEKITKVHFPDYISL